MFLRVKFNGIIFERGDVVIMHGLLAHSAGPNFSDVPRIAFTQRTSWTELLNLEGKRFWKYSTMKNFVRDRKQSADGRRVGAATDSASYWTAKCRPS